MILSLQDNILSELYDRETCPDQKSNDNLLKIQYIKFTLAEEHSYGTADAVYRGN